MRASSRSRAAWLAAVLLLAAATALAAAYPAVLRIPRREAGRLPALPEALFSHRTHDDMNKGRFCGRCHDGRMSFPVAGTACARCHVAR